jgi:citrate lyase subunit beta/citryl-CoA lyase
MVDIAQLVSTARSLLVVPGHRPDRFAKAFDCGADLVMLDLEDAVGPALKPVARAHIDRWLAGGRPTVVRINGVETPWYADDLAMVSRHRCAVMVPKASAAGDISQTVGKLREGSCVIAALETALGVLEARQVCSAPGVVRIILGNADLATDIGIDLADNDALRHVRSHMVLVSSACRLAPPMDGVTAALYDEQAVDADAKHSASLGFTGKACLHPHQVPVVNKVFTPSAQDIRWARDILVSEGDGSVVAVDGQVVGKPILDRARRLLTQVDR